MNAKDALAASKCRHGLIFNLSCPTECALLLLGSLVSDKSPVHTGILSQTQKLSLHELQTEISAQQNQCSAKEISLTMTNNM